MPALAGGRSHLVQELCVASPSGRRRREGISHPLPTISSSWDGIFTGRGTKSDPLNSWRYPWSDFRYRSTESKASCQLPRRVGSLQSPVPSAESHISSASSFFSRVAVLPPACPHCLHTVKCEDLGPSTPAKSIADELPPLWFSPFIAGKGTIFSVRLSGAIHLAFTRLHLTSG